MLKPYFQFSTNIITSHESPLHATPNTTKEIGVQHLDEVTFITWRWGLPPYNGSCDALANQFVLLIDFSPPYLFYINIISFYFAKPSINRVPELFLNIARSTYLRNQNKLLSEIPKKDNCFSISQDPHI